MTRRRNKKTSLNKRVLYRIVALAIFSGIVIASLFYAVEMMHIKSKAEDVLTEFMEQPEIKKPDNAPEVYYIGTEAAGEEYLLDTEKELLEYYRTNKEKIPLKHIEHFRRQQIDIYFAAVNANEIYEDESGEALLYTDVSFTTGTVRTATYILIGVVAGLSFLLYGASRYTIRILDGKDKSMKDFFSNASHELKTPLMGIRGYVDGWRDGIVPQEKACAVIDKEIDRMTGLINDILEFSKLDGGIAEPHMEENDVREILYDAVQVIEAQARKDHIEISLELPEPMLCLCDEEMLFSVFSNILTNSIRYARKEISIQAEFKKSPSHIKIIFSNDGKPISKEDAAHMFERFYKGAGGQSGIGMALSLEYIKLHGGDISVFTEKERTIFQVCIKKI